MKFIHKLYLKFLISPTYLLRQNSCIDHIKLGFKSPAWSVTNQLCKFIDFKDSVEEKFHKPVAFHHKLVVGK